jgi:S1-C subfamily serine protease
MTLSQRHREWKARRPDGSVTIPPKTILNTAASVAILALLVLAATAGAQAPLPVMATGSGFLIDVQGHVLTNAHVVNACSAVTVKLDDGTEPATILVKDEVNDVALLQVSKATLSRPLAFRQETRMKLGESVIALGYPLQGLLSSSITVTTGTVSSLAGPGDDNRLVQFTAPVQPGNSGGPLLDSTGKVIGMVSSKLSSAWMVKNAGALPENVNFAIKQSVVRDVLDARSIEYSSIASSDPEPATEIADKARAAVFLIECLAARV